MRKFYILIVVLVLISTAESSSTVVEKILLDSTSFQGSELNWDKEAFGDSNELPGWKEQSFNQKSGSGEVWRVHFVCDIASSNPNNWLRLPLINRDEANRILIKLEYTIRECKRYPGEIRSCKETFQMLYAEVDGGSSNNVTAPPDFSESNYKYLKTIAPNSGDENGRKLDVAHQMMTTESANPESAIFRTQVDLPLSSDKKGVYIVFRDQGACVSLLSIKVYYTLCASQVHNLVLYPRTPTGSNLTDLIRKSGDCISNAESKSTPYAYCQTNGNWFFVNNEDNLSGSSCLCKAGYYYSSYSVQCLACPQGRYKPTASNQAECLQCPDYSYSSIFASTKCTCIDGYYRLNKDDFESPCLPYPPEPKNMTVYYLDQTTIKLRWNAIENYEKTSVQYVLQCYKCVIENNTAAISSTSTITTSLNQLHKKGRGLTGNTSGSSTIRRENLACHEKVACESYVEMSPKKDEIFDNKVTLSSLDSNTPYFIELYAQHVNSAFKTKTVDIMLRTLPAIADLQIKNLTAYQFVDMNQILVLWSDENYPTTLVTTTPIPNYSIRTNLNYLNQNKPYVAYEIRYWPKGNVDKTNVISIKAPAQNFTFKNSNPNVISNNLYVFQIRGKTSRGWSAYSEPPCESIKISSTSFFYLKDNENANSSLASSSSSSSSFYSNFMITKGTGETLGEQQFSSINMKSITSNKCF